MSWKHSSSGTYLIMPQSHPWRQFLGHRQDVPQRVYLEFVEGLVHGGLEQGLELMHSVLDLVFRVRVVGIRQYVISR